MIRSLFIVLLLATCAFAQDEETVELPDSVMSQVVSRIVSYKFKPSRTPRTIPVAASGVKEEWLPVVPNVTFKLVPDDDIINYEKGVFLVEPVTREGNVFSINVGWGDFESDASGDTWKFTVQKEKVRLWPTNGGWGRVGGDAPPVVRGLKLGDISPNELPGYEFFKKGKLKNIRLGISTREDMKNIFGADCYGTCDYDDNWEIFVNYFESDRPSDATGYKEVDGVRYYLTPKHEFVNTLRFINLMPKKPIPFKRMVFPRSFSRNQSYSIGDDWDKDGFAGAVHTTIDIYTDGYGLRYEIYGAETFNNLKNPKPDPHPAKKGDLIGIEYSIPDALENKIYNKTTRKVTDKAR